MRSRRFGFLRHYKKIKIEGINLSNIVNKCIRNGIVLKDLKWKNPLESTTCVRADDYRQLQKLAGHSYRMTVLKEGGSIPVFKSMKANLLTVIGAFLLGALIFYQSLFVAEIRVEGYRTIPEESIRKTLQEAGLYEGAKKEGDYSRAKAALYENHGEITWVSIFEEGRLIKVNIAEAGEAEAGKEADRRPIHIVAARAGMVERILPLQGNAKVQKGDYVNKGDVLISGKYKYQSTDYSRGDDFYVMYSHAEGQVLAKAPRQLTFYLEKNRRMKEPTGKFIPGICIKLGHIEIDTARNLSRFEVSVRHEKTLLNAVRPLPVFIALVKIEEVELSEKRQSRQKVERVIEAAVRQYQKDEMEQGEEIVSQAIDLSESENLIKASVFLEVLEDIGEEKEIKIPKKDKNKDETDEKNAVQ